MLTDKFLEESGDDVSNDFSTLETLLLIWMGLRLRNLASLESIEEDYPKWKNKASREFFEYSGTEFQKVKKSSQKQSKIGYQKWNSNDSKQYLFKIKRY